MGKDTVTFTNNQTGESFDFPILEATKGPNVIDISNLYKQMGMFTFDRGYTSTAACRSRITYIDGDKGELMYRGYDISYLAKNKSFIETIHLLLNKKLPDEKEHAFFEDELKHFSFIRENMKALFNAFPDKAHPMGILSSAVSALSTFYFEDLHTNKSDDYLRSAKRIIAKIPTIAAYSYRYSKGLPIIYPDINKGFIENFLYMLRGLPYGYVDLKPIEIKALDTIFTLHADHEQNASTTTVRNVGSTNAHPYAAISAGICALWGNAHGGANEAVIRQLEMIGSEDRVDEFIAKAKDKQDPFRLMGFGHRVYKNFDPRAKALKGIADDLMGQIDIDSELLKIAHKVEQIALNDEYFIQRGLYPNVDFYSGLILQALKIPVEMFAVMFVIGRTPGWMAQWIELKEQPDMKIARPRQLYLGPDGK